jgi:putative endonuclease
MKSGFVYLMANKPYGTIYLGVTVDLIKRVYEHKNHVIPNSFTSKYGVTNLVYFECFEDIESAIAREKQIKNWKRDWKIALIEKYNPHWEDLYQNISQNA